MNIKLIKQSTNSGQVVILLLLILMVALAIGLSTIGRSILEVSTSRKSEDSSRAFSAAEAAIEEAVKKNENNIGGTPIQVSNLSLSNQAVGTVSTGNLPAGNNALAFPLVGKGNQFVQFWLASPESVDTRGYTGGSFDIYFGKLDVTSDATSDATYFTNTGNDIVDANNLKNQPAIEVHVIYWDGSASPPAYRLFTRNYDSKKTAVIGVSQPRDGFNPCNSYPSDAIPTNNYTPPSDYASVRYYCKVTVTFADLGPNSFTNSGSTFPIMVRLRILYTELSHPVALQPLSVGFPKQANVYSASGTSGDVKRVLEATNYRAVMPGIFDYVLFSANNLNK